MKRNYNLDFFRGIAAISIVFIHTVCKSGSEYVPIWMLDISLLIDVPLFIFISGMTFNYLKTVDKCINSLLKTWYKWIAFILLYFIFILIFKTKNFTITNIISAMFFSIDANMPLTVIAQSLWFMPMYFIVSITASVLINYCNKNKIKTEKLLMVNFIFYMIYLFYFKNTNTNISKILMYNFIYTLGYYLYNIKIDKNKFIKILSVIVLIGIVTITFGKIKYIDMYIAKFQFDIEYLLYSMPSILICWYYINKLKISKDNKLVYIGQNALSFYFAQGVSSSLIIYVARKINIIWICKLPIMFIINLILTIIISIILKKVTDSIMCKIKKYKLTKLDIIKL